MSALSAYSSYMQKAERRADYQAQLFVTQENFDDLSADELMDFYRVYKLGYRKCALQLYVDVFTSTRFTT